MKTIRINEAVVTKKPTPANDTIKEVLFDSSLPIKAKSRTVYNATTMLISSLFEEKITENSLKETKETATALLDGIIQNEITLTSLIEVSSYDYYTYTHSVNVAVYAMSLGKELKLNREELEKLACGAILHDIGKTGIDIGIVNKAGRLTEDEFVSMKNHPTLGYKLLQGLNETDNTILNIVKHHHEKLDGNGYPDKLQSNRIGIYAKIVAICDIFDALSTKRSYKPALSTFDSLDLMRKNMKNELDQKLLEAFIKMMGKQ